MELIGKLAFYRPINTKDLKSSIISSSKTLYDLEGNEHITLTMANGDEEAPSACYFESLTD